METIPGFGAARTGAGGGGGGRFLKKKESERKGMDCKRGGNDVWEGVLSSITMKDADYLRETVIRTAEKMRDQGRRGLSGRHGERWGALPHFGWGLEGERGSVARRSLDP